MYWITKKQVVLVIWYLSVLFHVQDGRRLPDSPRWKFIVEEEHITLLIYEIRREDQGLFECNVVNKMGKATCSARLTAQGVPGRSKAGTQKSGGGGGFR